jgi:hypothetical protein
MQQNPFYKVTFIMKKGKTSEKAIKAAEEKGGPEMNTLPTV